MLSLSEKVVFFQTETLKYSDNLKYDFMITRYYTGQVSPYEKQYWDYPCTGISIRPLGKENLLIGQKALITQNSFL